MVTLLIILMMACNLWMLFYLTREHERGQRDDGQDSTAMTRQEPSEDIIGKSKFRIPERTRTEKATCVPEAAIPVKAEAVDEKDVTFADELKDTGNHAAEKDVSRQVPDEDLDKVFEDNRTYAPDEDFDEEPPQAGGSSFDEIDRAARTVKDAKAKEPEILQAGKVFHELEGTEFYNMFRRNNARYEARVSGMVDAYLASIRPVQKRPRMKAAAQKEYENFNIRDYV